MYRRIMVVVDDRPGAAAAILEGTALAQAHAAEVLFFFLLRSPALAISGSPPLPVPAPAEVDAAVRAHADRVLAAAEDFAERAGVMSRSATGHGDDGVRCIVDAAQRRRCDLIAATAEDRNAVVRLLSGSLVPGLITCSPVPVLVCKERRSDDVALDAALAAGRSGHGNGAPAGPAPLA